MMLPAHLLGGDARGRGECALRWAGLDHARRSFGRIGHLAVTVLARVVAVASLVVRVRNGAECLYTAGRPWIRIWLRWSQGRGDGKLK